MSLWTPDGERPVRRDDPVPAPGGSPADPSDGTLTPEVAAALEAAGIDVSSLTPRQQAEAAAMMAEMAEVRRQLLSTPAIDVVANHLMGIYELAAIHLGENPPNFGEAFVAIESLKAVLDRLEGRFGESEATLREGLVNLELAFVQLKQAAEAAEAAGQG